MSRGARFALLLIALLVPVVLLAGDPDPSGEGTPLSPEGTGPAGAKAMVILLRELGAEVEVERGVPSAAAGAAVLLVDDLDDTRREGLLDWVSGGGTLVVADPQSPLTPPVADVLGGPAGLGEPEVARGLCDIAGLQGVERLEPGGGVLFDVVPTSSSCLGDGGRAFVVTTPEGRGRVVGVGSPGPFINDGLARADAAVLVAGLLAPEPDGARISFLDRAVPGGGDETLLELVPDRVILALAQLGLAFGAYVWFRARRAGRPVAEPQPTALAGSELVAAVGRLRQQERQPDRAGQILRAGLARTLGRRLGVPPGASVDDLAAAVDRSGGDGAAVRAILCGPAVEDGDALVTLAREIDETRREVLHDHE